MYSSPGSLEGGQSKNLINQHGTACQLVFSLSMCALKHLRGKILITKKNLFTCCQNCGGHSCKWKGMILQQSAVGFLCTLIPFIFFMLVISSYLIGFKLLIKLFVFCFVVTAI